MAVLDARNAAMYVGGSQFTKSTSLTVSLERSTAEVAIHQSTYNERSIGPISASFSGNAVVDGTQSLLFGYVTAGASVNIGVYPTNDTSDYWSFAGYFNSYNATGPADGFWSVDFAGVIDGTILANGFT